MSGSRQDIPWLLGSWPGRVELRRRYSRRMWPFTSRIAALHRSTLGRGARVVAVVGSVGKTTTMRAVSAALGVPVHPLALLNGNSNSALAGLLLRIGPRQKHAVLEVAINAPGEMSRYAAVVRPNIAVVTAIASDHWRSFRSLDEIRDEKQLIVRALPADGLAVLNADDPHVRSMAGQTRARVVLFGSASDADFRASDIELDWPRGTRFVLHAAGTSRPVQTRLIGTHMVYPALAAIAVATAEGVPLDAAIASVSELGPTPGRMEPHVLAGGAFALQDDFKGSEATFGPALDTLAAVPARRRVVVLGGIDDYAGAENAAYREIGKRVAAVADRVIVVGRFRKRYRSSLTSARLPPDHVSSVADVHAAIRILRAELGPGDVVLIKGRSQQTLGRIALALAGRDVRCRADPCPFRRMYCAICPLLETEFEGAPRR